MYLLKIPPLFLSVGRAACCSDAPPLNACPVTLTRPSVLVEACSRHRADGSVCVYIYEAFIYGWTWEHICVSFPDRLCERTFCFFMQQSKVFPWPFLTHIYFLLFIQTGECTEINITCFSLLCQGHFPHNFEQVYEGLYIFTQRSEELFSPPGVGLCVPVEWREAQRTSGGVK